MSKKYNDMAHVLIYLHKLGIELAVIASRTYTSKGNIIVPMYEDMNGISIYRIYKDYTEQSSLPVKRYDEIYDIAKKFQPDIIFCSQQQNMFIADKLRRDFNIPIVLFVEFAHEPIKLMRRRWYFGLKPLAYPIANFYWRWLSKNTKAIITSYIGDKKYLKELSRYGTPVYYVPWCNHIPNEILTRKAKKNFYRGIYVGSLSRWKNTNEFVETLPIILERAPVKEFVVVGPGAGAYVIKELKKRYGERIKYIESLPRLEALRSIQNSFFSYTPVKSGGWGFIGDSWGVKTPLLVTHNHYQFRNRNDSLVVDELNNIHMFVNQLYDNMGLYRVLQEGGFERYQRDHTAKSVGDKLLNIFKSVLSE